MPPEQYGQAIEMLRDALRENREDHAAIYERLNSMLQLQAALEERIRPKAARWWAVPVLGVVCALFVASVAWGARELVDHGSRLATIEAKLP